MFWVFLDDSKIQVPSGNQILVTIPWSILYCYNKCILVLSHVYPWQSFQDSPARRVSWVTRPRSTVPAASRRRSSAWPSAAAELWILPIRMPAEDGMDAPVIKKSFALGLHATDDEHDERWTNKNGSIFLQILKSCFQEGLQYMRPSCCFLCPTIGNLETREMRAACGKCPAILVPWEWQIYSVNHIFLRFPLI